MWHILRHDRTSLFITYRVDYQIEFWSMCICISIRKMFFHCHDFHMLQERCRDVFEDPSNIKICKGATRGGAYDANTNSCHAKMLPGP